MVVYNELGFGLKESVYQEALALELNSRGILCEREKYVNIYYKGQQLKQFYKMDLIVEKNIVIETKGVTEIIPEHRAQLFNYMRLANLPLGLLLNFGDHLQLKGERYVMDEEKVCYRVDKNMQLL